jgi:hypothetical protein
MFTNVLNEITSRLDTRFVLTRFFPSLVFWGGLAIVYGTDAGLAALLEKWQAQELAIQVMQIIIVLAWITFFAFLLSNQIVWLTKQFEGYWGWIPLIGKQLKNSRKKHYQRVLKSLNPAVDYERIYYAFPFPDEPEEVMPTQLGNILKNAERYSYQRYDMDAVLLWPRIYAVLPENFIKTFDQAKASLDFMLIISSLSALFAFISGVFLLVVGGDLWLLLLCALGGLVVAWLAYKSALEAAITYGQLIKSAFDLYKGQLWKQLGYQQPKSLDEERNSWSSLYELVFKGEVGDPDSLPYLGAEETESASSPDQSKPD